MICVTALDRARFILSGKSIRSIREALEACDIHRNAMLNGRYALLYDRASSSRMLLSQSGDTAWISCLYLRGECGGLFDAARRIALYWGCSCIKGPVSPDAGGFGLGLFCKGGAETCVWHPSGPAWWNDAFIAAGYDTCAVLYEMRAPVGARGGFCKGMRERAARSGITVKRMKLTSCECARDAYAVSADAQVRTFDAFARHLERVDRLGHRTGALIAYDSGRPAGWILYSEEGSLFRVLHIQVDERHRRTWCAPALIDAAFDLAAGCEYIAASTIDSSNAASLRMALSSGMTVYREYRLYNGLIE